MKLRPYIHSSDFDIIGRWLADERTHALWCAGRMKYPPDRDDMGSFLETEREKYGNKAFVAENDDGGIIGFFCCSEITQSGETMLKFVVIAPDSRGKGYGRDMIKLAVKTAFEQTDTKAVRLMVFSVNTAARKCYESAGFREDRTDKGAFTYKDEIWDRCSMVIRPEELR